MKTEHWNNDRIRMAISCDERSCLLELTIESDEEVDIAVEILTRPKTATGIPVGPPNVIHRQILRVFPQPNKKASAHFWLPPGIDFVTARKLYYRVIPATDKYLRTLDN